ncbi:MAG: NADH-quinone oxidoreductase subunit L, partial [Myxococcales bacterium]|nr:NADH-quinone oxidoreductase subunit L [Myxococcales bacterium]
MTSNNYWLLALIPLMPALGATINGIFGRKLPHKLSHTIAVGAIAASFVVSLIAFGTLRSNVDGHEYNELYYKVYQWFSVAGLNVDIAFMFDNLSALMCLIITGVGTLIHIYSIGYMHDDESYSRYFTYLNLFCFAMLLLVLGDNLLVLFIGWEGVGLASYLLIGFWFSDNEKASAGKKAFIVNRIGDAAFLLGMFILFSFTGTLDILGSESDPGIREWVLTNGVNSTVFLPFATLICVLLFIGCTGKSAQIPLYVWLPDAMAGPTPVSALIHAATMVTAGVYMVTRLNFLFTLSPTAMLLIATVGALTALFAASIAIVQRDIKKVLAYSTVSQLGYMFLAAGVGGFYAAVFHL